MIERFETFVNTINQLYRSIQRLKTQEMADFGLKGTHVMCLFQLQKHPDGLTAANLATLCEEDKAAISRALQELHAKALIHIPQPSGQRRYRSLITLTNDGMVITERMQTKIKHAVNIGAQGFNDQDRRTFYRVLLTITKNLNEASEGEQLL